jgi:ribosomal protein S18 acetylase RimI-like enzyme
MTIRRKNPKTGYEGLSYLLLPRGKVPHIGLEKGRVPKTGIGLLKSSAPGPATSFRYVYAVDGQFVSALQVIVMIWGETHVANVYTDPAFRRQGLATELFNKAKKDLGNVKHASDHSELGESWKRSLE